MESCVVMVNGSEHFLDADGELGALRITRYGKYADFKALDLKCIKNTEMYYITDWSLLSQSIRDELGSKVIMFDVDTNGWIPQLPGVN